MKTIIYTIALLCTSSIALAQNLDQIGNLKHTSETVVTSEMFKLISNIDMDTDDAEFNKMKAMIDNLKEIRIYATDDEASAVKMKGIVDKYINGNSLSKLMHVKEDDQKFTFHIRKGSTDKKVRDLVMFMDENKAGKSSSVFMIISGDIDLDQISAITKSLKVPGQKQIEKATK